VAEGSTKNYLFRTICDKVKGDGILEQQQPTQEPAAATTSQANWFLRSANWLLRKWLSLWHRVKALFPRLPILGGLAYSTLADHAAALKEFLVVAGFSTATFWLSAFIAKFSQSNAAIPYPELVLKTVSQGELFIFSVAILGPVLYTVLEEPFWAKRGFPEKLIHITLAVALTVFAAAGFSRVKLTTDLNLDFALEASLYIGKLCKTP